MEYTLDEVRQHIERSSPQSKIYVGCDSRQRPDSTLFVTVVVLHYDGNKGAKVFPFAERTRRMDSHRHRLQKETYYAVGLALEIMESVGDRVLEVHFDFNRNKDHLSHTVIKEAIGYCVGQGLDYKLKPDALAASSAADYLGRSGMRFRSDERDDEVDYEKAPGV